MKKYLLDSVILIDHFNNISQATDFIKKNHKLWCISAITRVEVLMGFQNEQAEFATKLLDSFELLVIDKNIADLSAKFRQTYRIKLSDAIQASTAIYHQLILVSHNTKDFKEGNHYFDRGDLVLCPYQLMP